MPSRLDRKQKTRERLVEAAMVCFASQGFSATPTLDVAREAGVAHGTVFAHFPTREALVEAVMEAFSERLIGRLHGLPGQGAGLRALLEAHLEGLATHERLYARLVAERALLPPAARRSWLRIQTVLSVLFQRAAERERAQGRIRSLPQHMLFNTWIGLVHHYLANADLFAPEGTVITRHGASLIEHYLVLLRP